MSTLTITINTGDSAAMVDDPTGEPADVLADVARLVEAGDVEPGTHRPLYDTNGARVGTIVWTAH